MGECFLVFKSQNPPNRNVVFEDIKSDGDAGGPLDRAIGPAYQRYNAYETVRETSRKGEISLEMSALNKKVGGSEMRKVHAEQKLSVALEHNREFFVDNPIVPLQFAVWNSGNGDTFAQRLQFIGDGANDASQRVVATTELGNDIVEIAQRFAQAQQVAK